MRARETNPKPSPEVPAGTAALRVRNYSLILDDIRRFGPTARTEIADRTGLSRATVSTLMPLLMSAGLVADIAANANANNDTVNNTVTNNGTVTINGTVPSDSFRSLGRPSVPLEFDGSRYIVLAVQIGVDDLAADWTDLAERPVGTLRVRHAGPGVKPQKLAIDIAKLVQRVAKSLGGGQLLASVILVMNAPVQHDPPLVIVSFDLDWPEPVALVEMVQHRLPNFSARIELVKDSNMATVAEHAALESAHQTELHDLLYLKADTGVGGGVILNGELFNPNRIGFEPGHTIARTNGQLCHCGRRGCLVAEASLDATLTRAGHADIVKRLGVAGATAALRDLVARKNPSTLRSLRHTGASLSAVVLDLSLLFDPIRVVIGGFWADVFDHLHIEYPGPFVRIGYLENQRHHALPNEHDYVLRGRLGEKAARTGALRYAIDQLLSDPLSITNNVT
jgi:predicted NBD/HSP70 family sugar kinase